MVKGSAGRDQGEHSMIYMGVGCLYLKLASRKNRPTGSLMKRTCWCKEDASTCPVHVLGAHVKTMEDGVPLFKGFTRWNANFVLRERLRKVGVENAGDYRTHDLRRGHAQDLVESDAPLKEILRAGEWRSPAYLEYLDIQQLEDDFVVEAHMNESSGGEELCT